MSTASLGFAPLSQDQITERKLQANRANAERSTGPRTDPGRLRSKMNALKHGLFADDAIVLPTESQAEHDQLRDEIHDAIQSTDAFEVMLAERMVAAQWKLKRLRATEKHFHEQSARAIIRAREHAFLHRPGNALRSRKQAAQEQLESEEREKTDWLKISPAQLICQNFSQWETHDRHEQRLENAFYRAERELRMWRAEKRKRALASESASEDQPQPQQNAVSQNEPTGITTQAQTTTCEIAPRSEPADPHAEQSQKCVEPTPCLAAPLAGRTHDAQNSWGP